MSDKTIGIRGTNRIRKELQSLNFSYICSLFLVDNIGILLKEVINECNDPNKVIFKFCLYELKRVEKSILCKGHLVCIPHVPL